MSVWIAIAAWTLIPFGVLGLLWSLIDFSLFGILINAVLIGIGLHDIWQLKRVRADPQGWQCMALSQALLGVVIAGSMTWLGLTISSTEMWQQAMTEGKTIMVEMLKVDPYLVDQSLAQSTRTMQWGLMIGAGLVLLSQIWVAIKLLRLAKTPLLTPPPLP